MAWTDEKKAKAVKLYKDGNPTPENSIELVKQIAEELEETANGVRMILTKAEVYVKKDASSTKSGEKKSTGTRVSKADSFKKLTEAIEEAGQSVDSELIEKLTGKQAVYFTDLIKAITK